MNRRFKDLQGKRFGRLIALTIAGRANNGDLMWRCICDCGQEKLVRSGKLGTGTKSCGCLRREVALEKIKHTHTGRMKSNRLRWLLWENAKIRAKKQQVPFGIEVEDIIIPKTCPLLEIPLVVGKKKIHANSPTLDKIIPARGYVRGNIQVISAKANWMKGNASFEEMERLIQNWKQLHG